MSNAPVTARPDWDTYFLMIADAVSVRADCTRRQVGAVIVKDNRIRATGYNGGRAGGPSCLAGQCPRGLASREEVPGYAEDNPTSYDVGPGACIALHAEQNAMLYCGFEERQDATLYTTCEPCPGCLRMAQGCGLVKIIWGTGHWIKRNNGWLKYEDGTSWAVGRA